MKSAKKENVSAEILIVEDSATQAMQLQNLLEQGGYHVSVARNGEEALVCLAEGAFHLVVSDIVMPGMDGYELCRKIKRHEALKAVPVLLLTHLTEPEDIVRGLACGADNFVTKPYDRELLLSQVDYILANRSLRSRVRSEMGIEVIFGGQKHFINSDRMQILDLLFSTFETSLRQKRELERVNRELKEAADTINTLHGILPICANCKKIRDDKGAWSQVEAYVASHSKAQFSHSICPECAKKLYPEFVGD